MKLQFMDSEARQIRAIAAMEAIEDLLEMQEPGNTVTCGRLGALLGMVFDGVREALPIAERMSGGANDRD